LNLTLNTADFSIIVRASILVCALAAAGVAGAEGLDLPPPDESSTDDVEIVVGEERTIFEYRVNGYLTMIKVVPKVGKPYYMVPADGSPHYRSLDYSRKLYPSWIILEW